MLNDAAESIRGKKTSGIFSQSSINLHISARVAKKPPKKTKKTKGRTGNLLSMTTARPSARSFSVQPTCQSFQIHPLIFPDSSVDWLIYGLKDKKGNCSFAYILGDHTPMLKCRASTQSVHRLRSDSINNGEFHAASWNEWSTMKSCVAC